MKQHISPQQFHELSHENQDRIKAWVETIYQQEAEAQDPGCFVTIAPLRQEDWLLSIGQLIEFLEEHKKEEYFHWWSEFFTWDYGSVEQEYEGEFCDALWESVKSILERNT